jgi:hypothetical protein
VLGVPTLVSVRLIVVGCPIAKATMMIEGYIIEISYIK